MYQFVHYSCCRWTDAPDKICCTGNERASVFDSTLFLLFRVAFILVFRKRANAFQLIGGCENNVHTIAGRGIL